MKIGKQERKWKHCILFIIIKWWKQSNKLSKNDKWAADVSNNNPL